MTLLDPAEELCLFFVSKETLARCSPSMFYSLCPNMFPPVLPSFLFVCFLIPPFLIPHPASSLNFFPTLCPTAFLSFLPCFLPPFLQYSRRGRRIPFVSEEEYESTKL
ncbi:hypothetical protein ILYODFUR_022469 [Ilyodon furcidens]|uniref:Uncharacterized protein n=1 Tax=Ilyodon furcidens TaxID=33524 RepID=A0ABV0UVN9_9TELE